MVKTLSKEQIFTLLEEIKDPEVPVLDIVEMGIVRNVANEGTKVKVDITPTYSGCPAMNMIEQLIVAKLEKQGLQVEVKTVFAPPWTTDWLKEESKQKLKEYGIAPPSKVDNKDIFAPLKDVDCPFCNSKDTYIKSEFGSTACKSLHYCNHCQQPFEHFKCL